MSNLRVSKPSLSGFLLGALVFLPSGARTQGPAENAWPLSRFLSHALEASPSLAAHRTEIEKARGALLTARAYPFNPKLTVELGDRRGAEGSTTDRYVSLSQELEIGGQRRQRKSVASEGLAAAWDLFLRERQLLVARIESTFAEAVGARELLRVAKVDSALAQEVLSFSRRRLERGASTQIEVNLAQASAGRSRRDLAKARAAYSSTRAELAALAGLGATAAPEPQGDMDPPLGEIPAVKELLEIALVQRLDLAAARRQEESAAAGLRLARAHRWPNLEIGAFSELEGARDEITGATVGIGLPLFQRNQGGIAQTLAARERSRHETRALRLAIEQEVASAREELGAAQETVRYLRDEVLGTLEDNVELLQRSWSTGRIGATEVVTLRREFVASRRELIEALTEVWLARVELDLATGALGVPVAAEGRDLQ